uniref:Peptidase_M1 domain-containing protein n=1 Tax=Macrostomum lignano TaxID=282301 RepID=A0A1I8FM04_9PLAT
MGTCTSLSQKGTGCLCLNYRGQLSDRLRGFYRSVQRCRGAATSETPCALTMLCPLEARRLLPCWDEPQLKATFQVAVEIPSTCPRLTALSNMPEEERRDLPSQSCSQSEPMPARELFYSELFGIPYPLPKPGPGCCAGAGRGRHGENWGLITYREAMLLVDENSSKFSMETVALVVGHEVAHQCGSEIWSLCVVDPAVA